MRIVFLGTPAFAVPTLEALIAAGHEIACVYSQPPRPAGRGQKLQPSPVHQAAAAHGIEVRTPVSLKGEAEQAAFRSIGADCAVVVAYGLILPRAVLEAPRLGCFNLHGSLLPRWRGAAPIQRAIMDGDTETGVMVMRMEAGLDTGPVLATYRTGISDTTTTAELQVELAAAGARLMAETLPLIAAGRVEEVVQPQDGVTYARKITPEEARIDWALPARSIVRHIHGLNPAPGAWTMAGETRLKVLRARVADGHGEPGTLLGGDLVVACGDGAVRIEELQRAGRGVQAAAEFVRGFALQPGLKLT